LNTENLSTLKIHKLSQSQYDRELEAGRIDENALYLTPDEVTSIAQGGTVSGSASAALTQIAPEPEEPDIPEVTTKGVVYIDNGTEFVAYQVFIDDGTTWKQYIPYIDTGTAWVECGQ
jgi:hypothetical protein